MRWRIGSKRHGSTLIRINSVKDLEGCIRKLTDRKLIWAGGLPHRPMKFYLKKIYIPTVIMNKKRFTEFSHYLEGFTQRIISRFSDSRDFVNDEKTQVLKRFPELGSVQPKSQPRQISVIEYTLTSSLNKERRKSYLGVENEIKRNTPEECVDSVNLLSKAIGNAHEDLLFYSSLQGDLLSNLKDVCGSSFPVILPNNINISRSHAFFLMKFHQLVLEHPKHL